jgi:hypothetical protein
MRSGLDPITDLKTGISRDLRLILTQGNAQYGSIRCDDLILREFGSREIDHAQRLYVIDIDRAVNDDFHNDISFEI